MQNYGTILLCFCTGSVRQAQESWIKPRKESRIWCLPMLLIQPLPGAICPSPLLLSSLTMLLMSHSYPPPPFPIHLLDLSGSLGIPMLQKTAFPVVFLALILSQTYFQHFCDSTCAFSICRYSIGLHL